MNLKVYNFKSTTQFKSWDNVKPKRNWSKCEIAHCYSSIACCLRVWRVLLKSLDPVRDLVFSTSIPTVGWWKKNKKDLSKLLDCKRPGYLPCCGVTSIYHYYKTNAQLRRQR